MHREAGRSAVQRPGDHRPEVRQRKSRPGGGAGCEGRRDGRGGASLVLQEPWIPDSFAEHWYPWTLTWTSFKEIHGPLTDKNMSHFVLWHSNPSTLGKHQVQVFEDPEAYHHYAFKI